MMPSSPEKDAARENFYALVSGDDARILTLAGPEPEKEVELARRANEIAQIVMLDKDPECVAKAKRLGVEAYEIEMEEYLRRTTPEKFDVINADFCGHAERAFPAIARAARATGRLLQVCVSYGREKPAPSFVEHVSEKYPRIRQESGSALTALYLVEEAVKLGDGRCTCAGWCSTRATGHRCCVRNTCGTRPEP